VHRHGIGPESAAALLITAGDNPDRMTSQASIAAVRGVCPIEALPADTASTAAATGAPTPPSTASR
jgi:transposase